MTHKEKAQELVDKYWFLNYGWDGVTKDEWAKEGALIAVDEIIKANPISFDEDENCIAKQWWKEVKTEIEKL